MYHFPLGAVINSAVKRSMEPLNGAKLQLKLKGNKSVTLYFTGTEFQLVFVGSESFCTDICKRAAKAIIQFLLLVNQPEKIDQSYLFLPSKALTCETLIFFTC